MITTIMSTTSIYKNKHNKFKTNKTTIITMILTTIILVVIIIMMIIT